MPRHRTPGLFGGLLLAAILLTAPVVSHAAAFTWDGGGSTNNWSEAANWNPTGVPGSTGSVIFDATSAKDVTIDANVRVRGLSINSAYTGTLTQSGRILVGSGGFIMGGGTFDGGSVPIRIDGNLTLSGGTLESTSGILSLSGSFVQTGGSFSHNNGTIALAAQASRSLRVTDGLYHVAAESTKEDGLAAYWKLDETNVNTYRCMAAAAYCFSTSFDQYRSVMDSSGNGWHASVAHTGYTPNQPTFSSDGAPVDFPNPGSLRFVASRAWARNPEGPTLGTSGTVAFWIRNADTVTQQVALSNYTTGSGQFLFVINPSGAGNATWRLQGGQCETGVRSSPFLSDGSWHHVAFSKSAADGTCSVYVDGSLVTTVAASSARPIGKGIMIGNHSGFDVIGMTEGWMDDVRLYSRALSAAEIAELYAGRYPIRTGGSTLTLGNDITVSNAFSNWNGTVAFAGSTLTAQGATIANNGTLSQGTGSLLHTSSLATITPVDIGGAITLTLTDGDENTDGTALDSVSVQVAGESLVLTETAVASGIFSGTIATRQGSHVPGNGIIEADANCSYNAPSTFTDPEDPSDIATAITTLNTLHCDRPTGSGGGGGGGGGGRRPIVQTASSRSSSSSSATISHSSSVSSVPLPLFHDVPPSAWFAQAVESLFSLNVVSGYKDEAGNPLHAFRPANPVTYAEAAKMILLSAGRDIQPASSGDWSSFYITEARTIIPTLFTSSLDHHTPATRGHIAELIVAAFEYPLSSGITPFTDLPAHHRSANAIATLSALGIMKGDDGTSTVRPDDAINRAELATLLHRLLSAPPDLSMLREAAPIPQPSVSPAFGTHRVMAVTNLRTDARSNAYVRAVLPAGTPVAVIRTVDVWAEVRLEDGRTGFVSWGKIGE